MSRQTSSVDDARIVELNDIGTDTLKKQVSQNPLWQEFVSQANQCITRICRAG